MTEPKPMTEESVRAMLDAAGARAELLAPVAMDTLFLVGSAGDVSPEVKAVRTEIHCGASFILGSCSRSV